MFRLSLGSFKWIQWQLSSSGPKKMSKASDMLDPLPVPAYLFEVERQRFLATNESFRLLLHYSEKELLNIDWRKVVDPEEVPVGERPIQSGHMVRPVRWRLKRKDGQIVKVVVAQRRINFTDDDGKIYDTLFGLVVDRGDMVIPASEAFPKP